MFDEIASGGMATVHLGRLVGEGSFARTVAIKRLRAQYARDPEFAPTFADEARLAARIAHRNVVATLDVVASGGELFVVMEYVEGEPLHRLLERCSDRGRLVPLPIAIAIARDVLDGLHAAHEAVDATGRPLAIVHRDVSPQNILVTRSGVVQVLDFGIAKAASRAASTMGGKVKGKIAYMAPEQVAQRRVDRRTDIFAAGVVLWETLTSRRLFRADTASTTLARILAGEVDPPSHYNPAIGPALDAIVMRALAREPAERFATAADMARALERLGPVARTEGVAEWLTSVARASLERRAATVAAIERRAVGADPLAPPTPATTNDDPERTEILDDPSASSDTDQSAPSSVVASRMDRARTDTGSGTPTGTNRPRVDIDPEPTKTIVTPPRWGRVARILALGALLVAGWIAWLVRTMPPPSQPALASTSDETARALTVPPTEDGTTRASPDAEANTNASASASANASTSANVSTRASAPAPRGSNPCSPPFYFDEKGFKRYKLGCL